MGTDGKWGCSHHQFLEKEFAGSVHRFLLLDDTPEAFKEIEWLKPHFMTENGELRLSIHALVVETRSCRLIVDTWFGNNKQREDERSNMLCGSFLRDLAGAIKESTRSPHAKPNGPEGIIVDVGRWPGAASLDEK